MPPRSFPPGALLCGAAALLAGPAAAQVNWDAWKPKDRGPVVYPEILVDAAWLGPRVRADTVIVLDVRSGREYFAGHVPGAAPWPRDAAGRLVTPRLRGDALVVCYGGRGDALAVGEAFRRLEAAGFAPRVLNGGWDAWLAAGGEVDDAVFPAAPSAASVADTCCTVDQAYVAERFGTPGTTLLDWRDREAWASGHIPHSLPFPVEDLVDEHGALRDPPDLRDAFRRWGPRPREYVSLDDEIIVCGSDPPPDLPVDPYLALRAAGVARVRYFPEGTTAWLAREDAPVTRIADADEVKRLLQAGGGSAAGVPPGAILFDLRGEREFRYLGRLPGAVHLPSDRFEADLEDVVAAHWPNADRRRIPVIVYCYGPECTRSRNCSTVAARHGFTRLYWFLGGPDAWRALGEELIREPPE